MTRLSSFYLYLVDLWRRCFAKEYWVEAEKTEKMSDGDKVAKHNFRECPLCSHRVFSLDMKEEEERCGKRFSNGGICNKILHRKGEYVDGRGRKFILRKSLYSKRFAVIQCLWIVGIITGITVFRVKAVPAEYGASNLTALLWIAWIMLYVWLPSFLYVLSKSISSRFVKKSATPFGLLLLFVFGLMPTPLLILGTTSLSGYIVVPFWENIPTQEQIYDQQYAVLKAMPLDYKRFGFAQEIAQNPRVNLSKEFVQIAKEDFVGLMKVYNSQAFYLGYGSPEMQEFYLLYQVYLESLETEDLFYQCQFDPWNLSSGLAIQAYPQTWEVCPIVPINSR
jgi:hypothetical protein